MELARLNPPCAVCTSCGAYRHDAAAINQPCRRQLDRNKRCRGAYGSAIAVGDWAECPACQASGRVAGTRCERCDGYGWHYVRGIR